MLHLRIQALAFWKKGLSQSKLVIHTAYDVAMHDCGVGP